MTVKILGMPVSAVESIIMQWKKTCPVTSWARFELWHNMSERLSKKTGEGGLIKSEVTLSEIKQLAAEAGTRVLKFKISRTLCKSDIYCWVTRRKLYLK